MATSEDSNKDAPSREARKEKDPVNKKSANKAGPGGRPGAQQGTTKEGTDREGRPAQRGPTDADQSSAQLKEQLKEAIKRSLQDQKEPDSGEGHSPGRSQGQSLARGKWTKSSGPATAPIQLPPHTLREGGGGGPKDTAREQGKEETRGNYPGEILGFARN